MQSLISLAILTFCLLGSHTPVLAQDAAPAKKDSAASSKQDPAASADETAIRDSRERFNEAIKAHDVDAIKSFLAPEYHIVTGRSDQAHGVENEAQQLKKLFADDPTFVCRRKTGRVRVNSDWGLAEELGNWRCKYTVGMERIRSSGVYAAKWQRSSSGAWLLQSEVFTTLRCQGSEKGCRPPDPID